MKAQYLFWGKITTGAKRGKSLGFPTANITLHKKIPEGIYISEVKISNEIYSGATFIGSAETFGEKDYKAEVYILDFSENIYGKWMSVKLLKKIRGNEKFKFKNEEELIKQIEKDVEEVRKYFKEVYGK